VREKIKRETKGGKGFTKVFEKERMHSWEGGKGMCTILIRLSSLSSSLTSRLR